MAVNRGFQSLFSGRALDGVMMMMMLMSKCLVILAHHERYISTVNCDFQSVLSDRARDKNAAGMQEQL